MVTSGRDQNRVDDPIAADLEDAVPLKILETLPPKSALTAISGI